MEEHKLSKTSSTMFLDGVRGFASLSVFAHHFAQQYQHHVSYGYDGDNHTSLFRLPILRVTYSGGPMVAIFFVVSGYALSHATLVLRKARAWEQILKGVSSSVFRRGLRLFLPAIIASFATVVLVQTNIYNFKFDHDARDPVASLLVQFPTFWEQVLDWIQFIFMVLLAPWPAYAEEARFSYNTNLWTIPLEFQSSMILYVTIVGLSRTPTVSRRIFLLVLSLYSMWQGGWCTFLFFQGMLLADVDLERRSTKARNHMVLGESVEEHHDTQGETESTIMLPIWVLNLLAGLYVASFPRLDANMTPAYRWLVSVTDSYRIWCAIGAVMILWSISRIQVLRNIFTYSFFQYVGKVSYSLYLVQGPFLQSCGFYVTPLLWKVIGRNSNVAYQTSFVLGFLIVCPLTLWAADIFWRLVDRPCIAAARIMSQTLLVD